MEEVSREKRSRGRGVRRESSWVGEVKEGGRPRVVVGIKTKRMETIKRQSKIRGG